MLQVLILDEDRAARARLRALLREHRDVATVAECATLASALGALRARTPHLAFLDARTLGVDGWRLLSRAVDGAATRVILVSAREADAVRAFDLAAVDCLLKPVAADRLGLALARTRRAASDRQGEPAPPRRILPVRSRGRIRFLRIAEIECVHAAGNYSRLHTVDGSAHRLRQQIGALQARLGATLFVRLHRSTLVNVDCIRELRSVGPGQHVVVLQSGERVGVGRSFRGRLPALLSERGAEAHRPLPAHPRQP